MVDLIASAKGKETKRHGSYTLIMWQLLLYILRLLLVPVAGLSLLFNKFAPSCTPLLLAKEKKQAKER